MPPCTLPADSDRLALFIDLPDQPRLDDTLWMPFASRRHQDTDNIVGEHFQWLAEHHLLHAGNARVFERARFHELAGRVYHQHDRDTLRLAADFIAALFVLDDLMDTDPHPACRDEAQARQNIERIRQASHTGIATGELGPAGGIALAMADLTRRLVARGCPTRAYLAALDVYFDGVIEETRRRSAGFSSVADYADVRVAFSAVYACIELGLAASGTSLDPALLPLARAANLSVSWVNDVYSWPKERALGEGSNLVRVLLDQRSTSEPAAFHEACRVCDGVVAEYLDLRDALAAVQPAAIEILKGWIRGNLDWHSVGTSRYVEHLSVAPTRTERRRPGRIRRGAPRIYSPTHSASSAVEAPA